MLLIALLMLGQMKCFAGLGQQNFNLWVRELYEILEFSSTVACIFVAKFKLIERTSIQR